MRAAAIILLGLSGLSGLPQLAGHAIAQPAPCEPCARGDALIDRFGIGAVRPLAREIAALSLGEPVTAAQYATIVALRTRSPTLSRLGALDDTELALVATALCQHPDDECTTRTVHALRCLAERCEVTLPEGDPNHVDVVVPIAECRRSARRRSPPLGLGFDWGNGWDRSRHPNDGRTWSLGIAGRVQLGQRHGVVVRVDRTAGRDEATDADADGKDDISTGSITRFSVLTGPSFVLDSKRYQKTTRFLRLDVLGGILATRTQPGEDGVVAGFDLGYQIGFARMGVRFVQGFADASSATTVLAHLGIAVGAVPPVYEEEDCSPRHARRRTFGLYRNRYRSGTSRLALGFQLPLGGVGISSQLGYLATGLGVELVSYVSRRVDAVAHVDLLWFPGHDRDRVIHQAALGGARFSHHKGRGRRAKTGFHTMVMVGYTHGAALSTTTAGTGPVVDGSIGWGLQDREGAAYFRVHGRFGLDSENKDYRAIFLSGGLELRFDPHHWRKRVRGY